jgi:hypothetical protein
MANILETTNKVFDNKIIEAKAKDLLDTSLNFRSLMTIDNSLAETEGMTKVINVYTYDGLVEELEGNAINSERGKITFEGKPYTVKRVQQVFDYSDKDFLMDSNVVDYSLKGANQLMVNKMTSDFIAEAKNATTAHEVATFGYEGIVEAIAKLGVEDESALFIVAPNAWKAELRLDEDYKVARMGEVVYNGQTATVAGIPVIFTNALKNEAFVMNKEAVKLFIKKDVEVEQDRDIERKINTVVLTSYYVCALVDETKICKITKTA